jgi:hypothetical protein
MALLANFPYFELSSGIGLGYSWQPNALTEGRFLGSITAEYSSIFLGMESNAYGYPKISGTY